MFLKKIFFGEQAYRTEINFKLTVLLLLAALIPLLHQYFGSVNYYYKLFKIDSTLQTEAYAVAYFFLATSVLMGIIPYLIIKIVFIENVTDYGLKIGDWRKGLFTVLILFPIIAIAFLLPAAYQEDFKNFYPIYKASSENWKNFLGFEFARGILYYFAWEFFFRGFLLFGMRRFVDDWSAILIQVIPSCLWHIGYPAGEIIMSIPAGIMFGIIALRTNSIVWAWLLHWLIGLTMDGFILITK